MVILFDSAHLVKPVRLPFGHGICSGRSPRLPIGPSDVDRAWWAYESNRLSRDYVIAVTAEDRYLDDLAELRDAEDRHERGLFF